MSAMGCARAALGLIVSEVLVSLVAACNGDPLGFVAPDSSAVSVNDAAVLDDLRPPPADAPTCRDRSDGSAGPEPHPLPFDAPLVAPFPAPPRGLAAADCTGDGLIDLVSPTTVAGKSTIYVLPGVKGGGFGAPIASPARQAGSDVLAGDLDADGRVDLVVFERDDSTGDTAAVYRGAGDGTFAFLARTPSFGLSWDSALLVDFDGDRRLDLAYGPGTPVVLLGAKDGTFRAAPQPVALAGAAQIAAGDLDGDGKIDLVAVTYAGPVAVLRGRGDGSFAAPTQYGSRAATGGRFPLVLGDFDGDGHLDLLSGDDTMGILRYRGRGDGTLEPLARSPSPVTAGTLRAADIDGDGRLDLVAAGGPWLPNATNLLWFARGHGDLTFEGGGGGQPGVLLAAGDLPHALVTADFDGDRRADLALLGTLGVEVFFGGADGPRPTTRAEPTGGLPYDVALGDFDRDGKVDVAVACTDNWSYRGDVATGLFLHRGHGDGTVSSPGQAIGPGRARLLAADVSGDGRPDLVTRGAEGIAVHLGAGDGSFAPPIVTALPDGAGGDTLLAAELDRDGRLDLVAGDWGAPRLLVAHGQGDGHFTVSEWPLGLPAWTLATGDFDGDGWLDVAGGAGSYRSSTNPQGVMVVLGDRQGGFATPEQVSDANTLALATADLDGLGRDALATLQQRPGTLAASAIVRRRCDGTWESTPVASHQRGARSIALLDVNLDGQLDLLVPQPEVPCIDRCDTLGVAVLLGRGGGAFGAIGYYPTAVDPWALVSGDLDGDGRPDLVIANPKSATFTILRNPRP